MLAALALSAAVLAPTHAAAAGPACTYSVLHNGRTIAIQGHTAYTEDAHFVMTYAPTGRVWHKKLVGQTFAVAVIRHVDVNDVSVVIAHHACTPV